MMEENVRLLTLQQQLEKEANGSVAFWGLSIDETVHACLVNGMAKRAEKVRSDFKVPNKR
jgi:vacuolar protein sorting-associated protein 16